MEHTMTPQELSEAVTAKADTVWLGLRKSYPKLGGIPRPIIKYNKRLRATAGRAFYASNPVYIDLSTDLLWEHTEEMINQILPHELAHIAAWIVYRDNGHGRGWKAVMATLNIPINRCHTMSNTRHESNKMERLAK